MDIAHHAAVMAIALAIDAIVGDPDRVWRRIAHPVAIIGAAIGRLDRRYNRLDLDESVRRRRGAAAVFAVVSGALLVGALIALPLRAAPWGMVAEAAIASMFLAQNSLYRHVAAVRRAFLAGGLGAARHAVSMIVGRDPSKLDEDGVARAAVESVAENFSDGVVAPAFWGVLFGLPGLIAYKAINTADSMIGHRTERHRDFGRAAARLDDLVNLPAARLSGLIAALAAFATGRDWRTALGAMRADARRHASPNAGWPEAAFAGALGVALGGPRIYAGGKRDVPYMNGAGRKTLTIADIDPSLRLFAASCATHAALVSALALAAWLVG